MTVWRRGVAAILACGMAWSGNSHSGDVSWKGALRKVHSGDAVATVQLKDILGSPGLHGVGPVAGLDGEITILGGKAIVSRVRDGNVASEEGSATGAAFLVWSDVKTWSAPQPVGSGVTSHTALEQRIESLASKSGVDTGFPFAFRLKGTVSSLEFHVLTPHRTGQASGGHSDAAKKIELKNELVEIVGFFSKNHEGVFTHKGSVAHLHVVTAGGITGHIDEISTSADVTVLFGK